jgi:hypothetical protein
MSAESTTVVTKEVGTYARGSSGSKDVIDLLGNDSGNDNCVATPSSNSNDSENDVIEILWIQTMKTSQMEMFMLGYETKANASNDRIKSGSNTTTTTIGSNNLSTDTPPFTKYITIQSHTSSAVRLALLSSDSGPLNRTGCCL